MERQTLMVKLYHDTGLAKAPAATEYVAHTLSKYTKVLVFGHHTDVLVRRCTTCAL